MINLTGAKVGDKYEDGNENIVELTFITSRGEVKYICEGGEGGFSGMYRVDGSNCCPDSVGLVAKHDPRPWLKDLPDADLFDPNVISIKVCEDNGWVYNMTNSQHACWHQINVIRMPQLTTDQLKDSEITIVNLKVWQVEFKDSPF